jgi:putative nucleotidyltransferase with HDIG domain
MSSREKLERVIGQVGDLPAMPETVAEVLQLTDDPGAVMSDVSEAIAKDPAFSAKILRVSNSPYYGMKQHVSTLKLALVILGVREIRNIALGVSVFESLQNDKTDALLASDFWGHSFMVAALCKKLGARLELGLQGEDFIAGLLHDIGKMVLSRQLGDAYWNIYEKVQQADNILLYDVEEKALGFSHADAAAALAERWNLPKGLEDAIWWHHREGSELEKASDPQLAALVRISNLASHDDFEQDGPHASVEDAAWGLLDTVANPVGEDQRKLVLESYVKELKELPPPTY